MISLVLTSGFFVAPLSVQAAVPTFSSVSATNIIGTGAQITWTTSEPAKFPWVAYHTTGGSELQTNASCFNDVTVLFTNHCVNLVGLSPSTLYHYSVKSSDSTGLQGVSGDFTFTSAAGSVNNPPPVPSTPTPTAYSGAVGISYAFSTTLFPDPDGNQVKAVFDWGDGTTTETAFVTINSGGTSSPSATHIWSTSNLYSIKVKAVDSTSLVSSWSPTASMTVGVPPASASNLSATVSGSNVNLTWTDNSNTETGFKLYRTIGGLWTDIGNVSANSTTYTVSNLATGSYDFKVQAYTNCCSSTYPIYSDPSNVASATVASGSNGDTTPPSVPPAPTLSGITSSQIVLTWPASTDNVGVTGYRVYRYLGGSPTGTPVTFNVPTLNLTETSLASSTSYTYTLAAYDAAGNVSNQGPGATATTAAGTGGTAPASPSNLSATANGNSVTLNWFDNSNNETGFKLYRGPVWTDIGNVGANVTTYTDTGLAAGTYTYHLNAFNSSSGTPVYSGVTNDVSVTISGSTSGDSQAPAVPAVPAISVISASQINLSWPASSDNVGVTGYKVYRCICGNTTSMVYLASVSTTNYQDMGLTGFTSYTYAIAAYDAAGNVSIQGPGATGTTFSGNATDTTAPVINSGSVRAENIIGDGAQIKWGTNENANSRVEYGTTSGTYPLASENRCDANGFVLDHCVNLTGLTANSRYFYHVKTSDAAGNLTVSSEFSFVSGTGAASTDTVAPSAPSGLVATNPATLVRADLAWTASTDNMGVAGYKIYRNGAFFTNIPATSLFFSDNTVAPLTAYSYKVAAYDGANNISPFSNEVQITTLAGTAATVDTTLPRISEFTSTLINNGNNVLFRIKFSEQILGSSVNNDSVYVYPVTYPNYKVPGTFTVGSDVVELTTQNLPDVDHILVVTANIKDLANNPLDMAFRSSAIRLHSSSATYPYPPTTGVTNQTLNVKSWGLSVDSTGNSLNGIGFNIEVDQSTLTNQNLVLFKASDASQTPVPVTMEKAPFFVNIKTQSPLIVGAEYVSVAKAGIKSLTGLALPEFSCHFIAQASGFYTGCPGVNTGNPAQNFNASLTGSVSDSNGLALANVNVHVFTDDFSQDFGGTTSSNGTYKLILPAGVYNVEFFPPWDRKELIKPSLQKVSLGANDSKDVSAKFNTGASSNRIIAGSVKFSDGTAVTDAQVTAYNENTHFWVDSLTDAAGNYKLSVGTGLFKVSFRPVSPDSASWQWPGNFVAVSFAETGPTETKTFNFTVPLSLKVTVKALDQLGNPIPNAGVMLDPNSSFSTVVPNTMPPQFKKTDSAGNAIFTVPSGVYFLRGFMPPELGFTNPPEQGLNVTAEAKASLIFRRREASSTIVITGAVKLTDGTLASNAFVWGWSEAGGFANTRTDDKGSFSLNTSINDRWHVGAGKELNGVPYKSVETTVIADLDLRPIEIVLAKYANQLPQAVTVAKPNSESVIAQANDGAQVIIPPNAAGSGGGTINVQMTPTVEAPSQADARIIGKVWDVGIKDQQGQDIKKFSDKLEITFPYNEEDLKKEGASANTLQPSFYDDTAGTWVQINDYTLDTNKKAFVLRINHLTRFALVAPADVTPPPTPTALTYALTGAKEVTLSWADPKADFHHTRIYRTVSKTDPGQALAELVTTGSYKDTSVATGKTYYYYVEAVDAAGNASKLSDLLKVLVTGKVQAPAQVAGPVKFNVTLIKGSKNKQVKPLQEKLQALGFYPAASPITSVYDNTTIQAVKDFQKAYNIRVTGQLGPLTRAALNNL